MADRRAAGWGYEAQDDASLHADNDNVARPTPADTYVVPNVEQLKTDWVGGDHVGESQECVALVKQAVPGIGRAANWREGAKINGYNDPPLEPGTAIATFRKGKYENNSTGNHAAIFLGFVERDGKQGMMVLDQFRGSNGRPEDRFIPFDNSSQNPSNYAHNYSAIRKPAK